MAIAAFALAVLMALPALIGSRAPTSPATVLGPGDVPGETVVLVQEGPDPGEWVMSGVAAPVGSQIEVDLRGECECLPYAATARRPSNGLLPLVLAGLGLAMAWRASRQTRAHRAARTGRGLLDQPPGPGTYGLEPLLMGRRRLALRFGLRGADGTVVGTLPLVFATRPVEPVPIVRIHDVPVPGRVIALSTPEGDRGLVSTEPLAELRSAGNAGAHPATGVVADLLGWGPPSPVAAFGRSGRVTPAEFGPGHHLTAVSAAALTSSDRWRRARAGQLAVAVTIGIASVLAVTRIPDGVLSALAVVALFSIVAAVSTVLTRWADGPLAVALVEAELIDADALLVARVLLVWGLANLVRASAGAPDDLSPAPGLGE